MTAKPNDEILAGLIERFRQAKASGADPDITAAEKKHPGLAAELRLLWATVELLEDVSVEKSPKPAMGGDPPPADREKVEGKFGEYELLQLVGAGAMGFVHRARHGSSGRVVAIKVGRTGDFPLGSAMGLFNAEVFAASRVSHPNIVPVLDSGIAHGRPFIVMPFIDGETLARRLARGPVREDEAARIASLLAQAVHAAHAEGFLHMDLKPSNIVMDKSGDPHVLDFGHARYFATTAGSSPPEGANLAVGGDPVGTPGYMAPEQFTTAFGKPGPATDVYSLGAILHEMLTGKPPFRGESDKDTLLLALHHEPLGLTTAFPGINPNLGLVCIKCLQARQDRRYSTAMALAKELDSWREHGPLSVNPGGWLLPPLPTIFPFGPPRNQEIIAAWGMLWFGHGAMFLALCLLSWGAVAGGVGHPSGLMVLWAVGLASWGSLSWRVRACGKPVGSVERQMLHIWASAAIALPMVFLMEAILGLECSAFSPVLYLITGMMFLSMAGIFAGWYPVIAAINAGAGVTMALSRNLVPDGHLDLAVLALVASLGFLLPALQRTGISGPTP